MNKYDIEAQLATFNRLKSNVKWMDAITKNEGGWNSLEDRDNTNIIKQFKQKVVLNNQEAEEDEDAAKVGEID